VDPERTADEAIDAPTQKVSTRPAPDPRPSDGSGGAETTRLTKPVERRPAASRSSGDASAPVSPAADRAASASDRAASASDRAASDRAAADRAAADRAAAERQLTERQTTELRSHESFRVGEVPTVPTNIYRARRPAVAIMLIIPAVAVGLLLIRALAISAFGENFLIGGVIASSSALAALPLLVAGLYGLVTGAAHGAEQFGFKVWARPPLAYLLVGVALVLAAGLAIR
jgi:hypothetical protein